MKILLDKNVKSIKEYSNKYSEEFWQLRTPLTRNKHGEITWALDNGCFTGRLNNSWYRMLDEARENNALFVTLPDIVGSARRTMDLFSYFELKTNGVNRALVLQDGIGDVEIPWDKISAVFVGGTDVFKTSQEAMQTCTCAKMLGKWIHVGRVNAISRLQNWIGIADSIDGSGISRFENMWKN